MSREVADGRDARVYDHLVMTRIALVVSLLAMALAGSASASGPAASAAKTCSLTLSQQRNSGATYLVQLRVTGVGCSTGLKVEKAWQSCRRATAGHTNCRRTVLGYRSTQKVLDSSKTQYDAKVTATSGARVITFIYTQNR
jgi:hypothetical protein